MPQINLLDSDSRTSMQGTRHSWLTKLAGLLLVLVCLLYGYLFISHRSTQGKINDTRNKTKAAQEEIANNSSHNELLTRQGQLAALNPLLKDHVYWSGLLPELARVSLRQGSFSTIEAAADGTLGLNVTMPTYADLDKFLQVFDLPEYNRQFSNVRVMSISQTTNETGQTLYTMRVQLKFNPDFIKNVNL